jgi:hypothetical protein
MQPSNHVNFFVIVWAHENYKWQISIIARCNVRNIYNKPAASSLIFLEQFPGPGQFRGVKKISRCWEMALAVVSESQLGICFICRRFCWSGVEKASFFWIPWHFCVASASIFSPRKSCSAENVTIYVKILGHRICRRFGTVGTMHLASR